MRVPTVAPTIARHGVRPTVHELHQRIAFVGIEARGEEQQALHLVAGRAIEPVGFHLAQVQLFQVGLVEVRELAYRPALRIEREEFTRMARIVVEEDDPATPHAQLAVRALTVHHRSPCAIGFHPEHRHLSYFFRRVPEGAVRCTFHMGHGQFAFGGEGTALSRG